MPKFFFKIRRDDVLVRDSEGAEFSDINAAVADAKAAAKELIAEYIKANDAAAIEGVFEIIDEVGKLVRTVDFAEALPDDAVLAAEATPTVH